MKRSVAKKWVEALRSGKYRQGKNSLKVPDNSKHAKYCCLGVLCEIAVKEKKFEWNKWFKESPGQDRSDVLATTCLPKKVADWAGLPETHNHLNHLAGKNDTFESFSDIATYIEKHYKKLGV